jgi:hypothetical protein
MRSKVLISAAATAFVLSLATGGAKAATVQFTVVDGVNTVIFDLQDSPAVKVLSSTESEILNVPVDFISNGVNIGPRDDTILLTDNNGNSDDDFIAALDSTFSLQLPGLFSGTTSDPTFNLGAFGTPDMGITISNLSATPLPSTWTMMLSALLGLGFILYRSRSRHSVAVTT